MSLKRDGLFTSVKLINNLNKLLNKLIVITVRKRSMQRLCFYTCLFVHRGGGCLGPDRGGVGGTDWGGGCLGPDPGGVGGSG